MKIIIDSRFINPEQRLGFREPAFTFISLGLAAGLTYGALKPIEMYAIPTHHDFHLTELSSGSTGPAITRTFGF